jgi:hypothetical protein
VDSPQERRRRKSEYNIKLYRQEVERERGLRLSGSGPVDGCCDYGNSLLGPIKWEIFCLRNCHILRRYLRMWYFNSVYGVAAACLSSV